MSTCGSCTLCCRLIEVEELAKPMDQWCRHAIRPAPDSGGCKIYAERPGRCRKFKCLWLNGEEPLRPELRPDKCHVVFFHGTLAFQNGRSREMISAHVDPKYPDAWKRTPVAATIDKIVKNGMIVGVRVGNTTTLLYPPRE